MKKRKKLIIICAFLPLIISFLVTFNLKNNSTVIKNTKTKDIINSEKEKSIKTTTETDDKIENDRTSGDNKSQSIIDDKKAIIKGEVITKSEVNEQIQKKETIVTKEIEPIPTKKEEIVTAPSSEKEEVKEVPLEKIEEIVLPMSPKTEETIVSHKTLKEQNSDLIQEIKNLYGYDVSYGKEDFWYGGSPGEKLIDEEKANSMLIELKKISSLFPTDFFKIFQGYNGFRVLLFEEINGAAGVASYEFGDDNLIALSASSGFPDRIFYHETFHIMEQYINYKTYDMTNPFDTWNLLNPNNFNYDYYVESPDYTAYDFDKYNTPNNISFVSVYAKTSDREDRAELFADLMFRGIKKNYMYKEFGINKKAKELSLILRNYFPNSNDAHWERFIDWS